MSRWSSVIGKPALTVLFSLLICSGCQPVGERKDKQDTATTQDTTTGAVPEAVTEKIPDSPVTNHIRQQPAETTAPPKGHEIKHGSDNDKLLDSIKAAKNKQKGL